LKEIFLQYIWQNQLYDKQHLQTVCGKPLEVISPGYWNYESGPDFLQAQIKIGDMIWFGAVEIHIDARDWNHHRHQQDPAYNNVVLHVAWHKNISLSRHDGTILPTLLLQSRVSNQLVDQYQRLLPAKKQHKNLSCANYLEAVPKIYKASALEKAAMDRLIRKSKEVGQMYLENDRDWYQTALQCTSRAFGFQVNAAAFATLGSKISYQTLAKESHRFESVLALLLGVSGMVHQEDFSPELTKLSFHLINKYKLQTMAMQGHEFRKARVRPANTPRLRIIQLAAFLYSVPQLLDYLIYSSEPQGFYPAFDRTNLLLKKHQDHLGQVLKLGKSSAGSILINAVAPFQFAYAQHTSDEMLQEKAREIWQQLPVEKHRYARFFASHGFEMASSMDSQAAIEQHRFYCNAGRCLECPIGNHIMKNHQLVII
jgi:hypothetical protein